MREVINYAFCALAWFAREALLAGIAKTAIGKVCNQCKTRGQLGSVCVQMLGHKCSFPNSHFFILVVRKRKSSGIDGKTSDCLSRNCLYYRYLELPFRK